MRAFEPSYNRVGVAVDRNGLSRGEAADVEVDRLHFLANVAGEDIGGTAAFASHHIDAPAARFPLVPKLL